MRFAGRCPSLRRGLPSELWLLRLLATLANYGLRYPAFDQFRLYVAYLGLDLPSSALQLENGHRPILPAPVRIGGALVRRQPAPAAVPLG